MVQDALLAQAILDAQEAPPCTVRREDLATVKPFQSTAALNRVRQSIGGTTASGESLVDALVQSRWLNGEQPHDYVSLYMRWLVNDAHQALKSGNPSDATWPLSELEELT